MKSEPQAVMSIASCCLAIPGIAGNLISVVILSAPGLRSRFSNLLISFLVKPGGTFGQDDTSFENIFCST